MAKCNEWASEYSAKWIKWQGEIMTKFVCIMGKYKYIMYKWPSAMSGKVNTQKSANIDRIRH